MNRLLKMILIMCASLLMFVDIGINTTSAAHRVEDQYPSNFNKLLPFAKRNHYMINHNFYKNGYLFNVYTVEQQENNGGQGDMDPIVVGIDNDRHVSNHQVWQALEGKDINVPHFIYYRLQAYEHNPSAEIKHIFSKVGHLFI